MQRIDDPLRYTPRPLERWMSGLSHTPGKRAWGYTHRGFESRLLRQRFF